MKMHTYSKCHPISITQRVVLIVSFKRPRRKRNSYNKRPEFLESFFKYYPRSCRIILKAKTDCSREMNILSLLITAWGLVVSIIFFVGWERHFKAQTPPLLSQYTQRNFFLQHRGKLPLCKVLYDPFTLFCPSCGHSNYSLTSCWFNFSLKTHCGFTWLWMACKHRNV